MTETTKEHEKRIAAEKSVEYIENGMLVGLGTGSTVAYLLLALAARVKAGLNVTTVVTSIRTGELAKELGIKVIEFDGASEVDLTIDGADELNERLDLIKGGGGALLREKIIASASKTQIIIADSEKFVATLGAAPLPVEVIKMGWRNVQRKLEALGCQSQLRSDRSGNPFITDEGNYIIDCRFGKIDNPQQLSDKIDHIVGVVEHGLFINLADEAIIGDNGSTRSIRVQRRKG